MARQSLLDHVPAHFHPVPWQEGTWPWTAAAAYQSEIESLMAEGDSGVRGDLILLGLGSDGHTCSLFPGTDALRETQRLFVANWIPKQNSWRLTATLPLLHAARKLVFLVTGSSKAAAVAQILEDQPTEALPARQACDGAREVVWFLDRDAAAHL